MLTQTTPPGSAQPTRDQFVMMGAGGLAFLASFLPWVSVSLGFVSGSGNAWQSGLLAWAPVLVSAAVAAAAGAEVFLGVTLRGAGRVAGRHLLIAGAAGALILMLARAIWLPSMPGVSISLGAGFFLAMIAVLAQAVSAVRYSQARTGSRHEQPASGHEQPGPGHEQPCPATSSGSAG
jgi:hypothetical protein